MKVKLFLLGILLGISISSKAQSPYQPGYLDTTFNQTGPTRGDKLINFGLSLDLSKIAVDNYGRTVIAACSTSFPKPIYVARLLKTGDVDTTFGTMGIVNIPYSLQQTISCIYIQPDQKILIGGTRKVGSTDDFFLMRLFPDGTLDNSFDLDGIVTHDISGDEQLKDIGLQSDGRIVVTGKVNGRIAVIRLRQDGSRDTTFNDYFNLTTSTDTPKSLKIKNDSIYVCGDYISVASVYFFALLKFAPDGTLDFRNDFNVPSNTYSSNVLVQPDGRILLGGYDLNSFRLNRFFSYGYLDTTFGNNGFFSNIAGTYPNLTNLLMDQDGNYFLTGSSSGYYSVIKVDHSGHADTTFANNGKLTIYSGNYGSTYNSAFSHDHKLLLGGIESGNGAVLKVEVKPVMHILGNSFVLRGSIEDYKVSVPPTWTGYTYQWQYTGSYRFFVPGPSGPNVSLVLNETSTSGQLICTAYSGSTPVSDVVIDIKINPNSSSGNQITSLQCVPGLTYCANSYIDYFNLNKIKNVSSNCSNNGYSDFTKSEMMDTLVAGGVYSITTKVQGSEGTRRWVAAWIDYNNDGVFNSAEEYLGKNYSDDAIVKVNNLIFKNTPGFDGPKRLRVRCRFDDMKANESCPMDGDRGETEDYLVVLSPQAVMEAPQIITPNDDGKNDFFVIRGIDPTKKNQLSIFDRWGAEKFATENYQNTWNGINKEGEKISPGTYYYVFTEDKETIRGFLEVRY